MKTYFVHPNSIVRQIWGKADTVLFIFAGSAAEFALNKAVDWLYFTGKLPADPLGRLFSTVNYAREIIFSEHAAAMDAIDKITLIHTAVEENRGSQIPDWAYRDVLFMLIDYSMRAFELMERKLTQAEKAEVFSVFYQVGLRMKLSGLPETLADWELMRRGHLQQDLICSDFTLDLYRQYKKHLGLARYQVLRQVQRLLVPQQVRKLLQLEGIKWLIPAIWLYKLFRTIKLESVLKNALLPRAYARQIRQLDVNEPVLIT